MNLPPDLFQLPPSPGFPPIPPPGHSPGIVHPPGEAIGFVFGLVGGIVICLAVFVYQYATMKPGGFWDRRRGFGPFGDPLVSFLVGVCVVAGGVLGAFIGRAAAYYFGAPH